MGVVTLLTPRAARHLVRVKAGFVVDDRRTPVTLVNATIHGFMAVTEEPMDVGVFGRLILPDGHEMVAEVRWVDGNRFGARFDPAIRTFTLAQLMHLSA